MKYFVIVYVEVEASDEDLAALAIKDSVGEHAGVNSVEIDDMIEVVDPMLH